MKARQWWLQSVKSLGKSWVHRFAPSSQLDPSSQPLPPLSEAGLPPKGTPSPAYPAHTLPLLSRPLPQSVLPPTTQRRCQGDSALPHRVGTGIALSLSILTLTSALGQRFYRQPALQVGTLAPATILAPEDARVVDEATTEAERAAARNGAAPVLVLAVEKNTQMERALDTLLQQVDDLRQQIEPWPRWPTDQISGSTQNYLRRAEESEWLAVWAWVRSRNASRTSSTTPTTVSPPAFTALTPQQQRAAQELLTYQQQQQPTDFSALRVQITQIRQTYAQAKQDLAIMAVQQSGLVDDPILLDLSTEDWKTTQAGLRQALNRMMLQGIAPGLPSDLLRIASRAQLRGSVPIATEAFAIAALTSVLQSNLAEDPDLTRQKAEAAAEKVPPVIVPIRRGEPIVRSGETIDQQSFVLLDHFNLSQRRLNLWGLIGFGVLTSGAIAVFLLAEQTVRPALRRRDHGLVVCILLGVSGLGTLGLAAYSLPAVGILVSSFYGATLGATLVGLLAIVLPIGTPVSTIPLVASAVGALVSSLGVPRLRSREEIALLGIGVGMVQGGVYLALTWILSPVSAATWYLPLTGAALQGIYGIISSVLALGLSPYLEHLFDLVTPIRLAELANPNRPLLKRLASEAPGTFQHTLFVASLAEAAARALGCNVELVRAGTLYHDIGKMHDPLGFIENQMGGPNKHDTIDDPWKSAEIIKKHVSEGIVMARRHRLPKAVSDFIPEHQGTMLISYFYHQAQENVQANPALTLDESVFRYDGPSPQSPETGIVMLADSCEAALRSLKEATPEEALAMVNRILKARWKDQQLADSGLTREHMSIIAQVFVQVWLQSNHKRIAYPKSTVRPLVNR